MTIYYGTYILAYRWYTCCTGPIVLENLNENERYNEELNRSNGVTDCLELTYKWHMI